MNRKSNLDAFALAITPYLNQLPIRNWLNYQGDTWSRYGVKLSLLASLEIWLQVNQKPQ